MCWATTLFREGLEMTHPSNLNNLNDLFLRKCVRGNVLNVLGNNPFLRKVGNDPPVQPEQRRRGDGEGELVKGGK